MAYEFKPYRSVYRDPQSVAVSQVLRDRYVQNFASDSMMDQALNEMLVAAEFEGDVQKADELRQRLQSNAAERVKRGDFENLGMQINMDVRDFSKNYQPLKQNYEAREKDKESKRKLLESGKISMDTYNNWEKRSLLRKDPELGDYTPYTGITLKEDGTVDRGSLYQPVGIAHDVNVDKEILVALQAIASERGGGRVTRVPTRVDSDGDGFAESEYAYKTSEGTYERISEEDVRTVTNMVLQRPDVRAYLQQQADFATYDMDAESLDGQLISRIKNLKGRIASGRMSGDEVDNARDEIRRMEHALQDNSIGAKRALARESFQRDRIDSLTQFAIDTKAVNNVVGGGEEWMYTRSFDNPNGSKGGPQLDPTPTVLGRGESTVSPLADPETGEVTVESARQAVINARSASESSIANLLLYMPAIHENMTAGGGGTVSQDADGNAVIDPAVLQMLDDMSMSEIPNMVSRAHAEGKLVSADGASISKNTAISMFQNAKEERDHFLTVAEAESTLFDVARVTAATAAQESGQNIVTQPSDWAANSEWNTALSAIDASFNSVAERDYISAAQQIMKEAFGASSDITPQDDRYGDLVEHLYNALNADGYQRISREDAEEVVQDFVQNPQARSQGLFTTGAAGTGMMLNPGILFQDDQSEAFQDAGQSFYNNLNRGHEATMESINELAQGNIFYPQSDKPRYVTKTDFDEFVTAVKTIPLDVLLNERSSIKGEPVGQSLAGEVDSLLDIEATWYTNKNGVPKPAFMLEFKMDKGSTQTVTVSPNQLIAYAPGIVEGFGFDTLDNVIFSRLLSIYNMAPGVVRAGKGVDVPYKDGPLDVVITFPAKETTTADGKRGVDFTQGLIQIRGTRNGAPISEDLTYTEFQNRFHEYGVMLGRAGDLAVESYLRRKKK